MKIIIVLLILQCFGIGLIVGGENLVGYSGDLFQDAKLHYLEGNISQSLREIDEYVVQYPINASGWNLKGLILLKNNSYIKAQEAFNQALNITPNNSKIIFNLGLVSYNEGNLDSAEIFFNRSLMVDPEFADAFFYQGLVQYNRSEYEEASRSFIHVTELLPEYPDSWLNLGMTYEKERRFDDAIKAYNTAIEKDPTYAKPWFFKGLIYKSYGRSSLATDSFENYTRLDPQNDQGWFWYAQSLKQSNQVNASIYALYKAMSINPNNTEYQNFLNAYSGKSSNSDLEFLFTPLSTHFFLIIIGLIVLLSFIAIIKRQ